MRNFGTYVLLAAGVSFLLWSGSLLSYGSTRIYGGTRIFGAVDREVGPPLFGQRVAGSYLLYVSHVGFPTIPALVNITRDGGFISSDASDFGAASTPVNSPVYGTWKRTGTYTIAARTLYIAFDKKGRPIGLTRTTGDFTFTPDFKSGSGKMLIELFHIDQDPLDPSQQPFSNLSASFIAKRITVP